MVWFAKSFLELLYESEKLDVGHEKLKNDFKEFQLKYEKALHEDVILRNKIYNLEMKEATIVESSFECLFCKSHMFDTVIFENLLKEATKSASFEKHGLEKRVSKNMSKKKNQVRRTHRVWQ